MSKSEIYFCKEKLQMAISQSYKKIAKVSGVITYVIKLIEFGGFSFVRCEKILALPSGFQFVLRSGVLQSPEIFKSPSFTGVT
jgi:fructose-1,6-bisphosphatase